MAIVVFCSCSRHDPSCHICCAGYAAYRAGRRAYRQGRSRNTQHAYHHGYGHRWSAGWEAGRNANPNTATARAKEKAATQRRELLALRRERAIIDHQIAALTK